MQKKNIIRVASLAALALLVAGCGPRQTTSAGGLESEFTDTYNEVYNADPSTFDYLADFHAPTFDVMTNVIDGLLEFDRFGLLQGSLAETWEANEDKTVWTFHLRKGQQWVTNDGSEYAEVTADDWVAGFQHLLDAQGGSEYVAEPVENAFDYMAGKVPFEEVGIKAPDKYTLVYTLSQPTPYFDSMLEYGPFWPLNRNFFESKGCGFGADWDADVCKFGILGDTTSVLYNGAYRLSEYTASAKISMVANEKYWDAKNMVTKKINRIFDDGSNLDARLTAFINGQYSGIGVQNEILERAKKEIGGTLYQAETTAATFYGAFNLSRSCYEFGSLKSDSTEKQKEDTRKAILNPNFRKAIVAAWDVPAQNEQAVGVDAKYASLRNTASAPGIAAMPEDYEDIPAGTDYIKIVEKYLNEKPDTSFDGSIDDCHSAFFNPVKAKEFAAKAKEELTAEGVDFPVTIDTIFSGVSTVQQKQANSFKQGIEGNLGTDFVNINSHATATQDEYLNAFFRVTDPKQTFYDFSYGSGWSPDYMDPQTYVNIYGLGNDLMSQIGINEELPEDVEIYNSVLGTYNDLLNEAKAEVRNIPRRYTLFAKAEAELLASAAVTPYTTQGGNWAVTRVIPHTVPYTLSGTDMSKYKLMKVRRGILWADEVAAFRAQWQRDREEAYKHHAAK